METRLKNEDIEINYKYRGNTDSIQGISFIKNKLKFDGSKVDRQFSYSKINHQLLENLRKEYIEIIKNPSKDPALYELIRKGIYQNAMDKKKEREK